MSGLPPLLLSQGRSAYRKLLRSARLAFYGDQRVLSAFKAKARNEFEAGRSIVDLAEYKAQLERALDVASILRHNIAQSENNGTNNIWKLKWRKDLELGDNSSIKRHGETYIERTYDATIEYSSLSLSVPPETEDPGSRLTFFPSLKSLLKAHKKRQIPIIKEEDIEETFIRGSGPGGQAINKTKSNVSLLHKPTGIRVTCQFSRSLDQNRKIARRILKERLDQIANPGLSREQVRWAKERERKRRRTKKAARKLAAKTQLLGGGASANE